MGCSLDLARKLRVITACGMSRSHPFGGNAVSVPLRMEMKCALNVLIARSARLSRWSPGDTNWYLIFASFSIYLMSVFDTSLSILTIFA